MKNPMVSMKRPESSTFDGKLDVRNKTMSALSY